MTLTVSKRANINDDWTEVKTGSRNHCAAFLEQQHAGGSLDEFDVYCGEECIFPGGSAYAAADFLRSVTD